jgi:formate dehydrogenase major subunit
VVIASARGSIEGVAIVTRRLRPFNVGGRNVHQVGLPYCFGWTTKGAGDSANLLTASVGDANTMIPETKAFMVSVKRKG